MSGRSLPAELSSCLRSNFGRIEQEVVAAYVERDPRLGGDPECFACVREAVRSAVALAVRFVERGPSWEPELPPAVEAAARTLARNDFEVEAVMRGAYAVPNHVLRFLCGEFSDSTQEVLDYLFTITGPVERLFNDFMAAYDDELRCLDRSPLVRVANVVERILAGEPADHSSLGYPLRGWHLGLIVVGPRPELAARALAERLGRRLLAVPREADRAWVWLGAEDPLPPGRLEEMIASDAFASLRVAAGETREGCDGWRLTHQEAELALGVMHPVPQRLVRCADVLLPAAVLGDAEVHAFVSETYLAPLRRARDADLLAKTLRAYFTHAGNAASTAAALGVDRHTVQRRLRRIERVLGRSLDSCRTELEVALRVEQLDSAGLAADELSA
jgi:PucR C-terminal helix-turn-helix domain/GGDEF-like domain